MASSKSITHLSRVRALYKGLLKLHRGLPVEMRALGDQYVKEEFRAHKSASTEEVNIFLHEWTNYYVMLAKQLSQRRKKQDIGLNLSEQMFKNFSEEQVGQLYELFKEAAKDTPGESSNR